MPDYIPRKTVEAIMLEVAHTPQDDASYLTGQMLEEQPVILEYLYRLDDLPFDSDEEIRFSEAEREYILYIGIVVWKTLRETSPAMRLVTWDDLDAAIAEFEEYSHSLNGQPLSEIPGVALQMIETHPEPELLRFIVDALRPRADEPAFPPIRPEYRWVAMMLFQIVLKAMLDSREA
jgi:hypothetical protein